MTTHVLLAAILAVSARPGSAQDAPRADAPSVPVSPWQGLESYWEIKTQAYDPSGFRAAETRLGPSASGSLPALADLPAKIPAPSRPSLRELPEPGGLGRSVEALAAWVQARGALAPPSAEQAAAQAGRIYDGDRSREGGVGEDASAASELGLAPTAPAADRPAAFPIAGSGRTAAGGPEGLSWSRMYVGLAAPRGEDSNAFLASALVRLERETGFRAERTIGYRPGARSDTYVVLGELPADSLARLGELPFVTELSPAPGLRDAVRSESPRRSAPKPPAWLVAAYPVLASAFFLAFPLALLAYHALAG